MAFSQGWCMSVPSPFIDISKPHGHMFTGRNYTPLVRRGPRDLEKQSSLPQAFLYFPNFLQ